LLDARRALAQLEPDVKRAAGDVTCVEVDAAVPRGVPLELDVQLTFVQQRGAKYRGTGTVTLTDAPFQCLPDVACHRVDPWAAGIVDVGAHVDLHDARVELIELPVIHAGVQLDEALLAAKPAAARAPVQADRSFFVPPPARAPLPRMRLRLALADGRTIPFTAVHEAFTGNIVLAHETSRSATGRLLFRGEPATGLASLFAERSGARVGDVRIDSDGTFTLQGLPFEPFDVVLQSARPGGELARFPLATLVARTDALSLDLGVLEVDGHAGILELELVDADGTHCSAHLRWSGRGVSGSASLSSATVHTLLLPPVVTYELRVARTPAGEGQPIVATPGRVRVELSD
jgi:hypothetical protein